MNLCIHISECSENKGRDKRRSTMIEIERAIELFEDEVRIMYGHRNLSSPESIDAHELALKLLRAELSRQENAPLTCGLQTIYCTPYSCEYCGDHIAVGWAFCPECGTPTKQKRYEPRGEKE